MLDKFLKVKHPMFVASEMDNAFEFIDNYYKRLYQIGIAEQHDHEFVPFQLQGDAK